MSTLIESARKALERYDAAPPASASQLVAALECVGVLRGILEQGKSPKIVGDLWREANDAEAQRQGYRPMWMWRWPE